MTRFALPRSRVTVCAVAATVLISSCNTFILPPLVRSKPGTTTTIILVRHAERDPGLDPPLNEEGLVRREKLADVLEHNGVTAIYTGDILRNRQTIEPLVERLGITPTILNPTDLADSRALANRLINEWLTFHAGGVVLWVGNTGPIVADRKGNLEEIYRALGGTGAPPNRYQDFYVVVVPEEGDPHFIETTYGGPSSLD
jgi:hypothetical protein